MFSFLFSLLVACGTPPPAPTPSAPPPVVQAPVDAPYEDPVPPPAPNRAPKIFKVEILPSDPRVGKDLEVVEKVEDPDGDVIDVERTWFVNDVRIPDAEYRRAADRCKRGDRIQVEVSVDDGQTRAIARSAVTTILNTPPEILNDTRDLTTIDGFSVQAKDADGDKIAFNLEGAPPSLTIDPERGVLHYKGSPDDPAGNYKVVIIAEDGNGGFARWTFAMGVEAGSEAQKKAAEEKAKAEAEGKRR